MNPEQTTARENLVNQQNRPQQAEEREGETDARLSDCYCGRRYWRDHLGS